MSNIDSNPPFSIAVSIFLFLFLSVLPAFSSSAKSLKNEEDVSHSSAAYLVRRDQMRALVQTEYGDIMSIDVTDGRRGPYHVQFITMEPKSLFLPVLLHSDMVFYVHTGSGNMSWAYGKDDEINTVSIKRGDIHRLRSGSVFFLQSDLKAERKKLRINAIFANTDEDLCDPTIGAYSSVRDLVRGFDTKILQSAFKVSEEVIKSLTNSTDKSAIVHAVPTKEETFWDLEARFLKTFLGSYDGDDGMALNKKKHKKKKHKSRTYNIFDKDPDFKNCNGWSTTVDEKISPLLSGSNIGLFMVNLTKGSMMGPHWNPMATEIAVVLHGEGMVRVVCSSTAKRSACRNLRFRVQQGDVFAVPMFHPMAQMSFNNDSLVFMGFSTTTRKNYPQFLAGKYSVFRTLNRQILAVSLNVTNTTIDQLLAAQAESIILDCTSCAEEEEKVMLQEIEKEREEEEAKKREEQRKREEEQRQREEEEKRRREEEEERRQREEEEAQRREEEERERERQEKEEEERRRQEEEAAAQREQEEARRQEEERERERQEKEEEDERRRQEEEAATQREQEEARRREEERERERQEKEEEDERRRQEEEAATQREQEEARRREEEQERERQDEEERQRREEEEEEAAAEEARRQEEERERKEQEEARRQEEAAESEKEEAGRQRQEEYSRRKEEEAQTEQEEARRQQEGIEGRIRSEEQETGDDQPLRL